MMAPGSGLLWSPWFRRAAAHAAVHAPGACRRLLRLLGTARVPSSARARLPLTAGALPLNTPSSSSPSSSHTLQDHRRKLPRALVGRPGCHADHRRARRRRQHPPHHDLSRRPAEREAPRRGAPGQFFHTAIPLAAPHSPPLFSSAAPCQTNASQAPLVSKQAYKVCAWRQCPVKGGREGGQHESSSEQGCVRRGARQQGSLWEKRAAVRRAAVACLVKKEGRTGGWR